MCKSNMKTKTIKISEKNWKRLMQWKLDFGLKNLDEIIEKILNIVPAKELKNENKPTKKNSVLKSKKGWGRTYGYEK